MDASPEGILRDSRFPTRQYPYRSGCGFVRLDEAEEPLADVGAGSIVRFFVGRDDRPVVLDPDTLSAHVNDPFAAIVLAADPRPLNLAAVIDVLDRDTSTVAVPGQRIYRVAEGGQIAWSAATASLDRRLRLVVTRHRGDEAELFVSTTAPFDSDEVFLQVFAWDPVLGAYNFYERRRGIWSWAGSSWQAVEDGTRGLGPFDSHVNGAPVMKELKLPWLHWHSQSAQIRDDFLGPDDPLRKDAFYHSLPPKGLRGAEDLETIVRSGVMRWTASRLDRAVAGGTLGRAPELLSHVLTTTTVNLTCAAAQSWSLAEDDVVRLPTTFFLDTESLLDDLGIPAALGRLRANAGFYLGCLRRHAIRLQDGGETLDRDAFFAFAVPEPSIEDRAVVAGLVARKVLSRRLAVTLLMVDFPNPVFSPRREALLAYVPDEIPLSDGRMLDRPFADAVRAATSAGDQASPEAEFLALWDLPDDGWETAFAQRLESYWAALTRTIATEAGFDAVFRLAESRRRQFRRRPLAEFGLTLPVATALDIPQPLTMTVDGEVRP